MIRTSALALVFALVSGLGAGAVVAAAAPSLAAAPAVAVVPAAPHPRASDGECIGLVLGGGGARGTAHVGVLKVLEAERVPICVIAGTSMGSVVGSLYAAGYRAAEIERILETVDWADLFTDDPARIELPMRRKDDQMRYLLNFRMGFRDGRITFPRGAIQGQKFALMLRRLLLPVWNVEDFDALPIPFRAVGADIESGEQVVFSRGDLAAAVRASLSVPGAFAPIRVERRLIVDGGIVNNVPVDVARQMGATRLIVVDVSSPLLTGEEIASPLSVTLQMISVMIERRTQDALATLGSGDVLIRPDMPDLSPAQFDRSREAIAAGEAAADRSRADLKRFSAGSNAWTAFEQRRQRAAFDPPLVEFLNVIGTRSATPRQVERQLADVIGAPLDDATIDTLESGIGRAYGLGPYERIVWRPVEADGRTGVEVTPIDKGWGPSFITFGLQLSDDFDGRSDYQLTVEGNFTGRNFAGGEWRNEIRLGAVAGLRSEWFQPFGPRAEFAVMPYLDWRAEQVPFGQTALLAEYRVKRGEAGIEATWSPAPTWQLGVGIVRGNANAVRQVGDPADFGDFRERYGGLTGSWTRDTLNDVQFPASGSRFEVHATALRPGFGSSEASNTLAFVGDLALPAGNDRWLFGIRGQRSEGDANLIVRSTFLGGFTNLSGYTERELVGTDALLVRTVYYQRIGDAERLFSVPAYFGASAEAGNVWPTGDAIDLGNLIVSGSLFIGTTTPFGPLFFGYGRASSGASAWYLNFGSLLRPLD